MSFLISKSLFCQTTRNEKESVDAKGIPGWDKVDVLANALISLCGLSVSNVDAKRITKMYNDLHEYDKKPLIYKSCIKKPSKGRFARSKKRTGHVGVTAIKR